MHVFWCTYMCCIIVQVPPRPGGASCLAACLPGVEPRPTCVDMPHSPVAAPCRPYTTTAITPDACGGSSSGRAQLQYGWWSSCRGAPGRCYCPGAPGATAACLTTSQATHIGTLWAPHGGPQRASVCSLPRGTRCCAQGRARPCAGQAGAKRMACTLPPRALYSWRVTPGGGTTERRRARQPKPLPPSPAWQYALAT